MADVTEEIKDDDEKEKQIMENVDFSGCDVCGDDHDTEECPILCVGKKVVDAVAPSRARLTLPQTLQVRDLTDNTTTIITTELISSGTQFGPLEAKRSPEFNMATKLPLKIFKKDGTFVYVDATDETQCNWMALVAPATSHEEMNLIAYQSKDDIFFSSLKQIKPGKELRVWYAPKYGRNMGISAPWESGNSNCVPNATNRSKANKSAGVRSNPTRVVKRRRKLTKHRNRRVRYYEDDDAYDDFESVHSHKEIIQQLDPRRLGFKEVREWKCSQCGDVFENCVEFACHLSDHYKPRQPGAKRRDAGLKRPRNFPCEICGQKFTSEKLQHRHKIRSHQRTLRELKKSQRLKTEDSNEMRDDKDTAVASNEVSEGEIEGGETPQKENDSANDDSQRTAESNAEPESETIAAITAALAASGDYVEDEEVVLSKAEDEIGKGSKAITLDVGDQLDDNSRMDSDEEELDDDVDFAAMANETTHFNYEDSSPSPSIDGSNRRRGPYKCDICRKCFEKSIYLFRHIRKHTGDFTCLKCYKVFARKESMLKHQCSGLVETGDEANTEFVCSYCNKSFGREHLLKRHLSKHTGEFTCELCGKSYTSKETLLDHSCPKYPEMERYTCEICHKTFTKLKYLDKHIPVHTGIFSCAICGKWLRSNDSLINHMRICGLVKELQANGTAICPHCKQEFDDLKTFRRHMYDHTHMFACESCNARFRNKLSLNTHVCEAERTIKCDECGKEFNSIASLNRHRKAHGDPQYSCDTCGRAYYREEALLKHPCERAKRSRGRQSSRRTPNMMPLICEICGSLFSSTSSLNVHKNLHGEKKFGCDVCTKRFHRKDLLLEHMAVHGQPEIPCAICQKLFKTKKSLDVHLLIHDGIKRFKCQQCDKTFHQKGNLQKHEETHTPGRKHACPHCSKAFSSKEYLTIHILNHTRGKIFACQTCNRSFVKEHQLKAHRRTFHSNQAYVCRFCGLSVKLRHSLKRHLEKKHANVRSEWESNQQIASMLTQRSVYEENEEGLIDMQPQETIITEVSPTQGAEVLLAVAGLAPEWHQAITNGARGTIEVSVPGGGVYPIFQQEQADDRQDRQTIIQHVLTDDGSMEVSEGIRISVRDQQDLYTSEIAVLDDQDQGLNEEGTIVLPNGTLLQSGDGTDGQQDTIYYVLTPAEEQ